MTEKLPISYPAFFPIGPIEQEGYVPRAALETRPSAGADRYRQALTVTAAALIGAILVLAFALSIQGVGLEDHPGVGPDRPPHPALPAPAPAPDYAPVAPLLG
jgi:hypothetical protein